MSRIWQVLIFVSLSLLLVPVTLFQAYGYWSGVQENGGQTRTFGITIKTEPQFFSSSSEADKIIHMRFFDKNTNQATNNVSFFLNVTKGNQKLMYDLFYTKDGSISLKFQSGGTAGNWTVIGDKEPTLDGWYSQSGELEIHSPIFRQDGVYRINVEILGFDQPNVLISPFSPKPEFDSYITVGENAALPPYEQICFGVLATDVKCNQGLVLFIKNSNVALCLKPQKAQKLFERGWGSVAYQSAANQLMINRATVSGEFSTPEEFFANGGRSYVLVTPDSVETNATIGSTVQVPLTITHKTSANPLPSLTVHYMGARCCASIRGYGDIDLNSTVKSSNSEITLLAGESTKVVLTISIPKDLPKSSVNATIPYNVLYALPDDTDPKEAVTSMTFFQIHIVG